ncbi:TetR/AcrR family transcriptional regulator [Ktedonospora formicarum]|uniref:HTH tetR-type domain-containing protein n=1 Tax=Ktedonospora formicarum TaxID=2778364 RepID=A0A8J3HWY6_9CHLR|nr:TetR/AcrR family transcriptional regulator [Ktedonospora formicarum]GHO44766.1 hypothetical protein KSX_29290 [Ktedonospora formicarum]
MTNIHDTSGSLPRRTSKREERAQRILDAACKLMLRYGYTKTTVDDIAREAQVAKGTIYLHWKTREELFMTLAIREGLEATLEMLQLIGDDQCGAQLSRMVRHGLTVVLRRPLARALYLNDAAMLGELLRLLPEHSNGLLQAKNTVWQQMIMTLREKNLLRTDTSPEQQLHICSSIIIGFITCNSYLPTEMHRPLEETLDSLELTIQRTLEPEQPPNPLMLAEVRQTIQQLHTSYLQTAQAWFRQEIQ